MTDLRSRLRDIERIEPPELWHEIVGREPMPRAGSRGRGRVLLAAAVAVAVVAVGVLLPLTLLRFGPLARSGGSGHHTMTITYPSESMEPTVHVGEALVIDLDAYNSTSPRRGDVVAFRFRGQLTVKRVIGLPGDVVEERQGQVYANGQRLDEPHVRPDARSVSLGPWTVPAGHVFVMGDNRPNSNDSRYGMGPIPIRSLVGKVLLGAQASSPSPPPSAAAVEGPGLVLPTGGPVSRLVAGDGTLYAVYQTGPASIRTVPEVVARIDARTGNTVRSELFVSVRDLQLAGGWLWVSGYQRGAGGAGLFRLDPRSLQLLNAIPLSTPGAVAAGSAVLWAADGSHLALIDPTTGRMLSSVRSDGVVTDLALDPAGRFLYVATSVPGELTPRSITQREASTGAVVATIPALPAVAVTALSTTTDGVWVSYATGLLGQVVFLRAGNLRQVAAFTPRRGEGGTNTIHANVGSGVLWVADDMVGSLWCADPATGALRARLVRPAPADGYGMSDVVTVGPDAYVGTGKGVYRLASDPRCGASP